MADAELEGADLSGFDTLEEQVKSDFRQPPPVIVAKLVHASDVVLPNYRQNALNFATDHLRGTNAKPEDVVACAKAFYGYIYGKDG